ncbi:histidine phosphatase family protein [Sporobolomyces salmoneus]|uniref:histidine phosphatase family protein n=1 Tax=Sporobolomyces salmoneus TaxID=183962 RepID=UPI00317C6F9F
MTSKILYLTRHAQAEHNVAEDYTIHDAPLTKLGREQSANLRKDTQNSWTKEVELIVSSPLKRPMQTMKIGYAPLRERLESSGQPVVVLPELQEVNAHPCDTGSSRETLESDPEFVGLDFSRLSSAPKEHDGNDWCSKKGFWAPENVEERARWVRKWLRSRKENKIVVVAHGDILRCLTEGRQTATPWANAEVRAYRFKNGDEDDEAELEMVKELEEEGAEEPTSSEMRN